MSSLLQSPPSRCAGCCSHTHTLFECDLRCPGSGELHAKGRSADCQDCDEWDAQDLRDAQAAFDRRRRDPSATPALAALAAAVFSGRPADSKKPEKMVCPLCDSPGHTEFGCDVRCPGGVHVKGRGECCMWCRGETSAEPQTVVEASCCSLCNSSDHVITECELKCSGGHHIKGRGTYCRWCRGETSGEPQLGIQDLIAAFSGGNSRHHTIDENDDIYVSSKYELTVESATAGDSIAVSPNGTIRSAGPCAPLLVPIVHDMLVASATGTVRIVYIVLDALDRHSINMKPPIQWQVRTEPDGTRIFTPK